MDQQFCNPFQLTSAGNSISYQDLILPLDTLNFKELEMLPIDGVAHLPLRAGLTAAQSLSLSGVAGKQNRDHCPQVKLLIYRV